jgi:hypothetical protein
MAMAAMKVFSAQGFLGVRNWMGRVSDPENGWFRQKQPVFGKNGPKLGAETVYYLTDIPLTNITLMMLLAPYSYM